MESPYKICEPTEIIKETLTVISTQKKSKYRKVKERKSNPACQRAMIFHSVHSSFVEIL